MKKKDIFNPAFKDLQSMIKKSQKSASKADPEPFIPEKLIPDDNQHFHEVMSDVTPLPEDTKKIISTPGPNIKPSHPAPDDEQEAMTHLFELVKGSIQMDITLTDEYIEGSVKGFNHKLMKRLKKGEFPIQDHIDLHGLTKQEAETKDKDFLIQSHKLGLRCVLIVHGRGLNSPDTFPVLKESLPIWLSRGPIRKIVLAFVTARPYDGGTGAVYVLLKKR